MQSLSVLFVLLCFTATLVLSDVSYHGGDIIDNGFNNTFVVTDSPYQVFNGTNFYYPSPGGYTMSTTVSISSQVFSEETNIFVGGYTGLTLLVNWAQTHGILETLTSCANTTIPDAYRSDIRTCRNPNTAACSVNITFTAPGEYHFIDAKEGPTSNEFGICLDVSIIAPTPSPSSTSSSSPTVSTTASASSTSSASPTSSASLSSTSSTTASATTSTSPSLTSSTTSSPTPSASLSSTGSVSVTTTPSASLTSSGSVSVTASSSASLTSSGSASVTASSSASLTSSGSTSITASPSSTASISLSATTSASVTSSISPSLSTSPSPLPCRHPDATRERALAWLKEIRCDHNPVDNMLYPNEGAAYTREYAVGKALTGCQPVDSTLGDCGGEVLFYHTCKPLVGKSAGPCKTQRDFLAASVKFSCDQTIKPVEAECYTLQLSNAAVRSHSPFACASSSPLATHF